MRLYLIRHADPDSATDSLTSQGVREAEALADRMHAERIGRLYCSVTGRSLASGRTVRTCSTGTACGARLCQAQRRILAHIRIAFEQGVLTSAICAGGERIVVAARGRVKHLFLAPWAYPKPQRKTIQKFREAIGDIIIETVVASPHENRHR